MEEKIPAAIDRYQHETRRLYEVLDKQLAKQEYLAGQFSIADIANWTWVSVYEWAGVSLEDLPNLQRWLDDLGRRPAFVKGISIPESMDFDPDSSEAEKLASEVSAIVVR
jgi:glutathione S-transferase